MSWGSSRTRLAIIRLIGAVLAEQDDEWTEGSRYMSTEILAACQKTGSSLKRTMLA
jgi:putative transposase